MWDVRRSLVKMAMGRLHGVDQEELKWPLDESSIIA